MLFSQRVSTGKFVAETCKLFWTAYPSPFPPPRPPPPPHPSPLWAGRNHTVPPDVQVEVHRAVADFPALFFHICHGTDKYKYKIS